MGEEIIFSVNDTNRAIGKIIANLNGFDSPLLDKRVKAIIITNLEQAQLWSLKMIKEAN